MNLWPSKKGPYDPLTYDIRRTISVRIMLHGPWLEMRFPKRNLPLRRMCTDLGSDFVEKEILSILSDFLSGEKLTHKKAEQFCKTSNLEWSNLSTLNQEKPFRKIGVLVNFIVQ